jgi:hypothetical protein
LKVKLPSGESGWIASWLVEASLDITTLPISKHIPTPPPGPQPPAVQAARARDLEVSFLNLHYDCAQGEWSSRSGLLWGYRSFQVDMYIKNLGDTPVEPPWKPARWIITDGESDYISDLMWQWINPRTGFYEQPTIQPGESAGWTFLAFPIDRNQWVKAAEFEWNGQIYRQEFDLGQFGNAHNYGDCGEPRPHTWRPTPTPQS